MVRQLSDLPVTGLLLIMKWLDFRSLATLSATLNRIILKAISTPNIYPQLTLGSINSTESFFISHLRDVSRVKLVSGAHVWSMKHLSVLRTLNPLELVLGSFTLCSNPKASETYPYLDHGVPLWSVLTPRLSHFIIEDEPLRIFADRNKWQFPSQSTLIFLDIRITALPSQPFAISLRSLTLRVLNRAFVHDLSPVFNQLTCLEHLAVDCWREAKIIQMSTVKLPISLTSAKFTNILFSPAALMQSFNFKDSNITSLVLSVSNNERPSAVPLCPLLPSKLLCLTLKDYNRELDAYLPLPPQLTSLKAKFVPFSSMALMEAVSQLTNLISLDIRLSNNPSGSASLPSVFWAPNKAFIPRQLSSLHLEHFDAPLVKLLQTLAPHCHTYIYRPVSFWWDAFEFFNPESLPEIWFPVLNFQSWLKGIAMHCSALKLHLSFEFAERGSKYSSALFTSLETKSFIFQPPLCLDLAESPIKLNYSHDEIVFILLKGLTNLTKLIIHIPSPDLHLGRLPGSLTHLELYGCDLIRHNIPWNNIDYFCATSAFIEPPSQNRRKMPTHFDAPRWKLSSSFFKNCNMELIKVLRATIDRISDVEVLDLLSNHIPAYTRPNVYLSIIYTPTGALIPPFGPQGAFRPINWPYICSATENVINSLIAPASSNLHQSESFISKRDLLVMDDSILSLLGSQSSFIGNGVTEISMTSMATYSHPILLPRTASSISLETGHSFKMYFSLEAMKDDLSFKTRKSDVSKSSSVTLVCPALEPLFGPNLIHLELVSVVCPYLWWNHLPTSLKHLRVALKQLGVFSRPRLGLNSMCGPQINGLAPAFDKFPSGLVSLRLESDPPEGPDSLPFLLKLLPSSLEILILVSQAIALHATDKLTMLNHLSNLRIVHLSDTSLSTMLNIYNHIPHNQLERFTSTKISPTEQDMGDNGYHLFIAAENLADYPQIELISAAEAEVHLASIHSQIMTDLAEEENV